MARFLLPHLRAGMRLLDCGCGPGSITVGLAEAIASGEAVGIDIEPTQLAFARAHAAEKGVTIDELAADRQGLKQFTTPQHRQLQFGSLLDDLVSDYRVRRVKSLGSALSHIKPVRDHFGDWRALDINFRAIEAYITKRREEKKSNATINRELELLRRPCVWHTTASSYLPSQRSGC